MQLASCPLTNVLSWTVWHQTRMSFLPAIKAISGHRTMTSSITWRYTGGKLTSHFMPVFMSISLAKPCKWWHLVNTVSSGKDYFRSTKTVSAFGSSLLANKWLLTAFCFAVTLLSLLFFNFKETMNGGVVFSIIRIQDGENILANLK